MHPECPEKALLLAGIMHKLSTAVPQTSTLTAFCFLGLLGVLHEYACGALRRTPCHRGACGTSSRKPMHNPGFRANRRRWDSNPRAQLITGQPDFESGPLRPLRYSSTSQSGLQRAEGEKSSPLKGAATELLKFSGQEKVKPLMGFLGADGNNPALRHG